MLPNNTTIDIKRKTSTDLENGSFTNEFTDNLTNVNAHAQTVSLRQRLLAGRKANSRAFNFYVDPGLDISMSDHVTYNSEEYEILDRLLYQDTYMKIYAEVINA